MSAFPWWIGLIGLLILAAVFLAVGLIVRAAGGRRDEPVAEAARGSRALEIGSAIVAALAIVFAAVSLLVTLLDSELLIEIPVQTIPIVTPDGVDFLQPPAATITSGGLDHATIEVEGLSMGTRVLLASSNLAGAAMVIVIALAVARLGRGIRLDDPFARGVGTAINWTAGAVLIGGILMSVLEQVGDWFAGQEALWVSAWSAELPGVADPTDVDLASLGWPAPAPFVLTLEFWPILIGFALAAVGTAFEAGERLRRRAETAERETVGLV